ncbi:MAG TPA: cation transporter [Bacteroidetes bacterium]|nr:cation transporter [Bacteroidota bacterium]HRK05188.1 cation diffusion facilitator family transporter [Chlorobiota bacterium]
MSTSLPTGPSDVNQRDSLGAGDHAGHNRDHHDHHDHHDHRGHHDHHGHHHHVHTDIRPLRIAIALTATVFGVQVVGGFISGSLALLSDAGHVLVDLASLIIAFLGLRLAAKARAEHDIRYTFGLRRIEILAALTNGFLLVGICIYICIEGIRRFVDPTEVHAETMLPVAVIGFIANAVSAFYLHRSEHITTRSAYLHVLTDLMSSGAVIIGAIIIHLTHWDWVDPTLSILIALIILRGAIRVIREAGVILMESAPVGTDPNLVREAILNLPGVVDVHDIHIWQLGATDTTGSVHVVSQRTSDDVVMDVRNLLREQFRIEHVTVQVESRDLHDNGDCGSC